MTESRKDQKVQKVLFCAFYHFCSEQDSCSKVPDTFIPGMTRNATFAAFFTFALLRRMTRIATFVSNRARDTTSGNSLLGIPHFPSLCAILHFRHLPSLCAIPSFLNFTRGV